MYRSKQWILTLLLVQLQKVRCTRIYLLTLQSHQMRINFLRLMDTSLLTTLTNVLYLIHLLQCAPGETCLYNLTQDDWKTVRSILKQYTTAWSTTDHNHYVQRTTFLFVSLCLCVFVSCSLAIVKPFKWLCSAIWVATLSWQDGTRVCKKKWVTWMCSML